MDWIDYDPKFNLKKQRKECKKMSNKKLELSNEELEQIKKIKKLGYIISDIIEIEGYKCAVVGVLNSKNCIEVIPFNEHRIYPKQLAVMEWTWA
jgi:ATP-dependent 26S proteasome regulatory subunit